MPPDFAEQNAQQAALETSWINFDVIIARLKQCNARNKIIILDTCKSGAIFEQVKDEYKTSYYALCAVEDAYTEVVDDLGPMVRYRSMTEIFCNGLETALAANEAGDITTKSIDVWLEDERRKLSANGFTELKFKSKLSGDIVLRENALTGLKPSEVFVELEYPKEEADEYLTLVEELDSDFPLTRMGELTDERVREFMALGKKVVDLLAEQDDQIRYQEIADVLFSVKPLSRSKLLGYYRKQLEVKLLWRIYLIMEKAFHNAVRPSELSNEAREVYYRLKRVDTFGYSAGVFELEMLNWSELKRKHQDKKGKLESYISKLVREDELREAVDKFIHDLDTRIDTIVDLIRKEVADAENSQVLEILSRDSGCSDLAGSLLTHFAMLRDNAYAIHEKKREFTSSIDRELTIPAPILRKDIDK
jgi:hypothetical protein